MPQAAQRRGFRDIGHDKVPVAAVYVPQLAHEISDLIGIVDVQDYKQSFHRAQSYTISENLSGMRTTILSSNIAGLLSAYGGRHRVWHMRAKRTQRSN